jgi:hypothetical protein
LPNGIIVHWAKVVAILEMPNPTNVHTLKVFSHFEQCDRMRTSFSSQQFTFFPLPIQGMFYHWSCDLARELPQTSRGNVYIMIMIELFQSGLSLLRC